MAVTAAPGAITLRPELYETLDTFARAEGKALEEFVSELLYHSLAARERQREIECRDGVMDELTAETERLGLYDSHRRS